MPKVSVILTSYNHGKFIEESINSVLSQTYSDFELIIWDDSSTDGSWQIIQSYTDKRIRKFQNPERYMGGNVNRALKIAQGEYIAIHHSDDVWESGKLEKQVVFLDTHPAHGAVFTNALAIGEDSNPFSDPEHFYSKIFSQPNRTRHQWLNHFFYRGNALCHPSVLIRMDCYEKCGPYRVGLAQLGDFDMWVRLCFKYEIHVLEERLTKFRVRDGEMNTSGNRPEVRIRDRAEFFFILKNYLRLGTFEELVSIFPEAEKYYRPDGCEPRFVLAMVALGQNTLPWAKFLGIETLFDLHFDENTNKNIKSLYQFNYRDFTALTGKYDLFSLETVADQGNEIAKRSAFISEQAAQIEQLVRLVQTSAVPAQRALPETGQAGKSELPVDRSAYEQAARLLESGRAAEGKALLATLAAQGSTCSDVYNDLAVQYFNEGDSARAVPWFEKGIAQEGRAGTIARNFAAMLLATGDVEGALAIWGGILHEQPHDPAILTLIRDVLSNINPIPPAAWERLVSDIRKGAEPGSTSAGGQVATKALSQLQQTTSASEVKIFQIYYDEDTKSLLDPAFIPLDNSENSRPDWCEYWPIRKLLLNQTFEDDTYIGFFSPRFLEKTGMSGQQVLEVVRHSEEEVISFSPYFDQGALHPSPFYHGESHHVGLLRTAQNVLALLNVNLDLNALVCDQASTIFSNYFVARYSFWKRWFAYAEKIFAVCEGPDCELKHSLVDATSHRHSLDYAMKVFIIERLVTIVMEESHATRKVGIDIRKAPLSFQRSKAILDKLIVCDELKSQFRNTGLPAYVEIYVWYRNKLLESKLT